MLFRDIVEKRYSVRKFKDMVVEEDKIKQILETVRYAPSAVNYQPWHFIVVTNQELKTKIAETYDRDWLKRAPVIIVACGNHNESWKREDGKDHCDIDVAIAVDHMTLAATELGLGTCWVCNFNVNDCKKVLELPDHLEPISLIPLGYPVERELREKQRKNLDSIVCWER